MSTIKEVSTTSKCPLTCKSFDIISLTFEVSSFFIAFGARPISIFGRLLDFFIMSSSASAANVKLAKLVKIKISVSIFFHLSTF